MEIKIGVRSVHRELVVESDLTAEQVEQELGKALSADRGIFALTDVKGRRVLVPMASSASSRSARRRPARSASAARSSRPVQRPSGRGPGPVVPDRRRGRAQPPGHSSRPPNPHPRGRRTRRTSSRP
nr:hypothetical protein GCM10020093_059810 [Planobispora longispora]